MLKFIGLIVIAIIVVNIYTGITKQKETHEIVKQVFWDNVSLGAVIFYIIVFGAALVMLFGVFFI